MKPHLIAVYFTLLLLPLGLKLSIPTLLKQDWIEWSALIPSASAHGQYTVESVEGYTLTVRTPEHTQMRVRLAGLQSGESTWQNQAAAVITMLLNSSQATVSLTRIPSLDKPADIQAIASLPNGTPLQQILLADGLAKLDRTQLKHLPVHYAQTFQQAEISARSQHKNIWGSPQPTF